MQLEKCIYFSSLVVLAVLFTGCGNGQQKLLQEQTVIAEDTDARVMGSTSEASNQERDFQYISHRGCCDTIPENTAKALSHALDMGFDGVELDVWEAESGELFVFHDATLARMCNCEKYIWEMSTDNRNLYPIQYKEEEVTTVIPTLGEVLDALKDRQCPIYLHIKIDEEEGHYFSQEAANEVAALLRERNLVENTIIFSTYQDTVVKLFFDKGLHLGYITGQTDRAVLDEKIAWCVKNQVETLILYKMDGIKMKENGAGLVEACHKNGLSVGVYKVKTQEDEQMLLETGADFSISSESFFE